MTEVAFIPGKGLTIEEDLVELSMEQKHVMAFEMQTEREKVAPKFERWRDWHLPINDPNWHMYKVAEGGRGAGAKTWSVASLIVQKYNYAKRKYQCLCVREFMNSLAESSYAVLKMTIERLGYANHWEFTERYIRNTKNGSYFIFRGLRDIRAAEQLKSYEGYDDLFADEASAISLDSWQVIIPTLRKKDKQIWVIFNRELEMDPCMDYFVKHQRPRTSYFHLEPGRIDNPWWDETSLQADMDADYERDPDEAEHIWKGLPRSQGFQAAMSRVLVRQAMERDIDDPEGMEEGGVDVARFGNDTTQMYKRKGMKIVKHDELNSSMIRSKANATQLIADYIWNFFDQDPEIPIKIDVGYNPGVADALQGLGAYVVPINFGGEAMDKDKYPNAITEMWFEFPIEEADLPDDPDLMVELSTRLYDYDKKGRKIIEQKKEFKKRYGKSPDKADALLLCYYSCYQTMPLIPEYDANDLGL